MHFDFYQLTSVGDRKSNQDYMDHVINEDYALFIVADGLGGYQAGKRAAGYFCQGFLNLAPEFTKKISSNLKKRDLQKLFIYWADKAVDEMVRLFAGDNVVNKAHTTCAILYIDSSYVITAHCGDSRIYRMQSDEIVWRTKDHSIPQKLYDQGEIDELEMGYHPGQNQLTKTISIEKKHRVEVRIDDPVKVGETFVLCTDGFWSTIKEYELLNLAQAECSKKDILKQAKTAYLRARGRSDNLTVQWVRVL